MAELTQKEFLESLDAYQAAIDEKWKLAKATVEGMEDDIVNMFALINNGTILAKVEEAFEGAKVVGDKPEEESGSYVFEWGKYKGKTLSQIYDDKPDYLQWVCNSVKDANVRGKAREFADSVGLSYTE